MTTRSTDATASVIEAETCQRDSFGACAAAVRAMARVDGSRS
jgi:hypothetical protein